MSTDSNKRIINLATPTNGNDAANNSCMDGINYEMGHDNEKETKL